MKLIPLQQVPPGATLAQDIYVREDRNTAFLRRGAVLDSRNIGRLQARGVQRVYVQTSDDHALSSIVQLAHNKVERPKPVISQTLQTEAVTSLEKTFTGFALHQEDVHAAAQLVTELDTVVQRLVRSLDGAQDVLLNISDLKSYDDYTYHHSLSVAVMSIGLGQHLGLDSHEQERLGLSAILHDIGKTAIPVEIIRKPGKLTDAEFDLIKTHSSAGAAYLMNTGLGNEDLWLAVLTHHEKIDGTGYPNGLTGDRIPLWGRIISVADVYDALTSQRPYRNPMQPADAMEYIMGSTGSAFDYDIVTTMLEKVNLYPVGSVLELSDNSLALVLDSTNTLRPVVEILGTAQVVDLQYDRQYLNVVINRLVPEAELLMQGA